MRFKLVKTGKSYGEEKGETATAEAKTVAEVEEEAIVPPIIWKTGNILQLRSTLVWKEAEVIRLKAQLTGAPRIDSYALNQIRNLEGHIADIRRWLAEAKTA